jgi:hypothetical protein
MGDPGWAVRWDESDKTIPLKIHLHCKIINQWDISSAQIW